MSRFIFVCIIILCFATSSVGAAQRCSTFSEKRANSIYCKELAEGAVNLFVDCLNERAREDCNRREQEEVTMLKNIVNKYNPGRSTCFTINIAPIDYEQCMIENMWSGIEEDSKMLEELCSSSSSACDIKKTIEKEKNKRRLQVLAKKEEIRKKEHEEYLAKIEIEQKITSSKSKALRAECGEDYKNVRVGMKFSRVEKCVGKFRLTGQINKSDGVVSMYERSGGFVNVMDGTIVSWGRN